MPSLADLSRRVPSASPTGHRRLHLGSGPIAPANWINVDKSWTPFLMRRPLLKKALVASGIFTVSQTGSDWPTNALRLDVTRRFPWPDESMEAIYSAHMVEHLTEEEARRLIAACHRVLEPGGVLRLALPDLTSAAREYLARRERGDREAAEELMNFLYLVSQPSSNVVRRAAMKLLHRPHQWMYDASSMSRRLEEAGFGEIFERAFRDGLCPDLDEIETREDSFFVEAVKV